MLHTECGACISELACSVRTHETTVGATGVLVFFFFGGGSQFKTPMDSSVVRWLVSMRCWVIRKKVDKDLVLLFL